MRIFLSGDEEQARHHLPIAQAKVNAFVERCEKAGLKQNTFAFIFKETGTKVFAQYAFGQVQMQVDSPRIPVMEDVVEELIEPELGPKTFYVNTTQGYFWVEVRYTEDGPYVILTPFEAMLGPEEFKYPAMGHNTPGMVSGSFGTEESRYVVSQSAGVFIGEGEEKGSIKLPPSGASWARINVQENTDSRGQFCIIENTGGQDCSFSVVDVSPGVDGAVDVSVKHGSVSMLVEGEGGAITPYNLMKTPCWIHRKCAGSYFSPNKTIGFYTDIGSDDEYFGNADIVGGMKAIPSGIQDKLDNGAEFGSYFNHSPELYRIAGLVAAPLRLTESAITLVLVSPTMIFDLAPGEEHCWGGYGEVASNAKCIDIREDLSRVIFAPRLCEVVVDLRTGEKTVTDLFGNASSASGDIVVPMRSWDESFGAEFVAEAEIACGPKYFHEEVGTKEAEPPCGWTEDGTAYCDNMVPVEIEISKEQNYLQQWAKGFEENLRVFRGVEFRFNCSPRIDSPSDRDDNFYFLFDGLWHLSFAVMYLSTTSFSNQCKLCGFPQFSQTPGEEVIFYVSGSVETGETLQWLADNATEYVRNMRVTSPLALRSVVIGGVVVESLTFTAEVNENLEAPHPPEVLVGGIRYPAPDVEGELVECEYTLMSAPCECSDMEWDGYSPELALGETVQMTFTGGCPPFIWSGQGVSFVYADGTPVDFYERKKMNSIYVKSTDECSGRVHVSDICGGELEKTASVIGIGGIIVGPSYVSRGDTVNYYHDFDDLYVTYTGTLPMIGEIVDESNKKIGVTCYVPIETGSGAEFVVSFSAKCSNTASKDVTVYPYCDDSVPSSGNGDPRGIFMRAGDLCGVCTSSVLWYYYPISLYGATNNWECGVATVDGQQVMVAWWYPASDPWTFIYFIVDEV